MTKEIAVHTQEVARKIFLIRGHRVMIDRDLAEMYEVETRRLIEQVKRNIDRFPDDFMFQLTKEEEEFLRSQNAISKKGVEAAVISPTLLQSKALPCCPASLKAKEPRKSISPSCGHLCGSGNWR